MVITVRIVETKKKYGQLHAGARAKHYRSAGRVDEQPCQQRTRMKSMSAICAEVEKIPPYPTRVRWGQARLNKKRDSKISKMSINMPPHCWNVGLLTSRLFRSLTLCSTEAGRSAWYPERAAPILVKATRVRTRGCLIPAVWLAVAPVSKPDCTYTIPKSIEAQFEAQRSTGVSGHSRSPNQLRNVHRYATSVVHSIRIGVETVTVPL
jgi:hypothetical protein